MKKKKIEKLDFWCCLKIAKRENPFSLFDKFLCESIDDLTKIQAHTVRLWWIDPFE